MRRRPAAWTTRCASLGLALAVASSGAPAHAAPEDASASASAASSGAASSGAASSGDEDNKTAASGGEAAAPPASPEPDGDGAEDNVEAQPPPSTVAGMGSSVISSNNPEAQRARADLEGTALVTPQSGVPERMRPLQRAAWWTTFGAFALATTGGLFAGFAEVQEDRAQRLASTLDPTTGSQSLYADKQAEYEEILAKGERQAWVARGLLIGAGVTAIAAITIFAVDARRQQRPRPSAQRRGLHLGRAGLEVRF